VCWRHVSSEVEELENIKREIVMTKNSKLFRDCKDNHEVVLKAVGMIKRPVNGRDVLRYLLERGYNTQMNSTRWSLYTLEKAGKLKVDRAARPQEYSVVQRIKPSKKPTKKRPTKRASEAELRGVINGRKVRVFPGPGKKVLVEIDV
jgi:hypothetical protein